MSSGPPPPSSSYFTRIVPTEGAMPGNADASVISNIKRGSTYNGGPARQQAEENRALSPSAAIRWASNIHRLSQDANHGL